MQETGFNERERIARQLESIEGRYEELSIRITLPEVISDTPLFTRLMREHSELSELNDIAVRFKKLSSDLEDAKEMLSDPDMAELARAEIDELNEKIDECVHEAHIALLPKDPDDQKNAILEVRAGAGGDEAGLSALDALKSHATAFCPAQEAALSALAAQTWSKAVVLADSGMAGLLEEGALAFKEICRRDSNHYHLLDVRHGPMVQIGADTLVIAVLSSGDRALQAALLSDVARKTGHLLVLDCASSGDALPGTRIQLPECGDDDAKAVFALFCIQLLCFHHAIARGVDPDKPEGLDPWIKL